MVANINVLNRFFYFLMDNPSPEEILAFHATEEESDRIAYLAEKNKGEGLDFEEEREVEYFHKMEHLVRMAKAKALMKINGKGADG